jgi:transposase
MPNPVISKSLASPSSVAWLFHQKFELSLPFYRQEKEWQSNGITLNRATMANWVIKSADLWLKPIFNLLHQQLLTANCIFADETPTQVLREPGKSSTSKSYMWLYRTSADLGKPTVLYEYSPTRSGSNVQQFLSGFSGYLHCDGYEGYNKVQSITRVGCWAHVRRKFHDGISKTATIKKSQCEIG